MYVYNVNKQLRYRNCNPFDPSRREIIIRSAAQQCL